MDVYVRNIDHCLVGSHDLTAHLTSGTAVVSYVDFFFCIQTVKINFQLCEDELFTDATLYK